MKRPDSSSKETHPKTMKIIKSAILATVMVLTVGSAMAQSETELVVPEWMIIDNDAKTVKLEIIAGKTDAVNYWNFNGYANGGATIVIPDGYSVSLSFTNNDPIMPHSLGIGEKVDTFPAMFDSITPAFDGALSSNPTDMMSATKSGETEELAFTAAGVGEYAVICYIPGHATVGMWIGFNVSGDGSVGVSTP